MTDKCQLRITTDCEIVAEVRMTTATISALTCVPCGKAFQSKYPHVVDSLSIRPLLKQEKND